MFHPPAHGQLIFLILFLAFNSSHFSVKLAFAIFTLCLSISHTRTQTSKRKTFFQSILLIWMNHFRKRINGNLMSAFMFCWCLWIIMRFTYVQAITLDIVTFTVSYAYRIGFGIQPSAFLLCAPYLPSPHSVAVIYDLENQSTSHFFTQYKVFRFRFWCYRSGVLLYY